MPDNNDTLQAVLLRKASSIGAPTLPPVTEEGMPLSPGMMGKGLVPPAAGLTKTEEAVKTVLKNPWLHPRRPSLGNTADELMRLMQLKLANSVIHGAKNVAPYALDYLNKGVDYALGYDPNAIPIEGPVDASKPQK